jgi:hypothetical protein
MRRYGACAFLRGCQGDGSSLIGVLVWRRALCSTFSSSVADTELQVRQALQRHADRAMTALIRSPHLLVKDIARDLPDEVMEDICERHGGLSGYLRTCTTLGPHIARIVATDSDGKLQIVKHGGMDALPLHAASKMQIPEAPVSRTSTPSPPRVVPLKQSVSVPPLKQTRRRQWIRLSELADGRQQLLKAVGVELHALCPAEHLIYDTIEGTDVPVYLELSEATQRKVAKALQRLSPKRVLTPSEPPADYDAFRLARFLSTETFVPLSALRLPPGAAPTELSHDTDVNALHCWDVTQADPLWIALNFPTMFQLDDAQYPSALLFVLSEEHQLRHLVVAPKYEKMSVEELEQVLAAARKEHKNSAFKLIKVRKGIRRAIQQKKFPLGSPFLHQDVLAYYVFDLLPEGTVMTLDDVRGKLVPPALLERCGTFSDTEFMKYPHLFDMSMSVGPLIRIRRREQHEEVGDASQPVVVEDLQLLAMILESLPKNFVGDRSCSLSMLSSRLGKVYAKQVVQWLREKACVDYPIIFRRDPKFPDEWRIFVDLPELERQIRSMIE